MTRSTDSRNVDMHSSGRIKPDGSTALPITHDEFVRHGAATGVPRKVFDLWVEVGAFVVPERDPNRRGIGDGYRLLDPYMVADMQDPDSIAFLTDPSGYPFVEYGDSLLRRRGGERHVLVRSECRRD